MPLRPSLVIAGASGVVGRALIARAAPRWRVIVLTRTLDGREPPGTEAVAWNPRAARQNDHAQLKGLSSILDGTDAIINLAGASIDGRFGPRHRRAIRESRVDATTTLVRAAELTFAPPRSWLQASAVGLYGDRGDEVLTEDAPPGNGLHLCEIGRAWEEAAAPAADITRLVVARLGVVFSRDAAAWRRLVLPVRLGVGGPLGSGQQWWPWIHAADLARALLFLIDPAVGTQPPSGVFNVVAPQPARQIRITRAIARALGRPAIVPVPAFALRLVLGRMADEVILPSTRVLPARLREAGFEFRFGAIEHAAQSLLKRHTPTA